jgi:hypothetical protein
LHVGNAIKVIARERLLSRQQAEKGIAQDSAEAVPLLPTPAELATTRDAVDCIIELYELEGIVLLAEIPAVEEITPPVETTGIYLCIYMNIYIYIYIYIYICIYMYIQILKS